MSSSGTPKTPARSTETQDPVHQVKFLLSVWRNCENGKIDWAPVLQEFNIATQGAAAKRLERLLKAHDMKVSLVAKNLPSTQSTGAATKGASAIGSAPSAIKRPAPDPNRTPLPNSAKKPRTTTDAKGKSVAVVKNDEEDEEIPIKAELSEQDQLSDMA